MPKRKWVLVIPEVTPPRQTVDPAYAADALEKMGEAVALLARKARKRKGCRHRKRAKPS